MLAVRTHEGDSSRGSTVCKRFASRSALEGDLRGNEKGEHVRDVQRFIIRFSVILVAAVLAFGLPGAAFAAPHTASSPTTSLHPLTYATSSPCVLYKDGQHCDKTDPYDTGCAGSGASYYVVASFPLEYQDDPNQASWSYGYVQLWWSDTCHTNWTRTVSNINPVNTTYAYVSAGGVPEYGPTCYCADTHSPQVYGWGIPATAYGETVGQYQYLWYDRQFSQ